MKFKVGDRVMLVRRSTGIVTPDRPFSRNQPHMGAQGVVVGWDDVFCLVRFDEYMSEYRDGSYAAFEFQLEPLDDRPEAGSWDEICALTRGWRPGVYAHAR